MDAGGKLTSILDIYCTANILVKQHGEDAPILAAMRTDAMIELGDLGGGEGVAEGGAWAGRRVAITVFIRSEIAPGGPSCYHRLFLLGSAP